MLSGIEELGFLVSEWVNSGDEVVSSFVVAATARARLIKSSVPPRDLGYR